MSFRCPWCHGALDRSFVRGLGKITEPCPLCGNPVRASIYQVLFDVLVSIPAAALALFLSKVVFDMGSRSGTVLVLIAGIVVWVYLYKYIPCIRSPAKGAV